MQGRIENEIKIQNKIEKELINLPKFVEEWYLNLKASKKTASSCNDFVNKIRKFLYSIDKNIMLITPDKITMESVEKYFISIQTKKNKDGLLVYTSDSYQQSIWCALNNFLEFMCKRKYIPENYIKEIDKPKNRDLDRINENRILLTQKDFNNILKATQQGTGSYKARTYQKKLKNRDVLIMLLFMTTGMRKTALSEINIEDINFSEKSLKVIDKGNKIHYYKLNDIVEQYLLMWLNDREILLNGEKSDALFISDKKQRLTGIGIYQLVEKYCEEGLGYKISPHKLRSGFCSILYNKTHDAEFVRRAVGHSNVSTTQRYIRTNNEEKEIASNIMNSLLKI